MGESLMTVVAIFVAAILMFVFPLMSVAQRNDDISQLAVQTAVVQFVDKVSSTGQITASDYNGLMQSLGATGNTYSVDMEAKILDENPGKKVTLVDQNKIGENVYYSQYTSQILDQLASTDTTSNQYNGVYYLKSGDIISVDVKNTNQTLSQLLRNFFYTVTGNDSYQVSAEQAKMVTANGYNVGS